MKSMAGKGKCSLPVHLLLISADKKVAKIQQCPGRHIYVQMCLLVLVECSWFDIWKGVGGRGQKYRLFSL